MRASDELKVTAIIPAYNEEERIGDTICGLRSIPVTDIIVVNDGSTDATSNCARCHGVRVIDLPQRRGKGSALTIGAAAACPAADVLLFIDADTGSSAARAGKLIAPILRAAADLVIGVLPPGQSGGLGIAQFIARLSLKLTTGHTFAAPLSGQRAIAAASLGPLLPFARGFGAEAGMNADAIAAGLKVLEVPVDMRHRATGRSYIGWRHRGRQLCDVAHAIMARALRWRRVASA